METTGYSRNISVARKGHFQAVERTFVDAWNILPVDERVRASTDKSRQGTIAGVYRCRRICYWISTWLKPRPVFSPTAIKTGSLKPTLTSVWYWKHLGHLTNVESCNLGKQVTTCLINQAKFEATIKLCTRWNYTQIWNTSCNCIRWNYTIMYEALYRVSLQ